MTLTSISSSLEPLTPTNPLKELIRKYGFAEVLRSLKEAVLIEGLLKTDDDQARVISREISKHFEGDVIDIAQKFDNCIKGK